MTAYVQETMDLEALEQDSIEAEAEAASKQFEDEPKSLRPKLFNN
jgi:hypothetical protein